MASRDEWILGLSLFFPLLVCLTHALVCPLEWMEFSDSCYFFREWPSLKRDDARTVCSDHGGGLLAVTSRKEHNFISKYLQTHILSEGDYSWYTSGVVDSEGEFATTRRWQATGALIGEPHFWLEGALGTTATQGGAIVYRKNETEYGWALMDPAQQNGYICEVPRAESYRIIQDKRDYDYGLDSQNLNDLERGPHFIKQPKDIIVVDQETDAVELECVVTGRPIPIYSWWRGVDFETEIVPARDSRYTLSNGKLIIHNPSENTDSGRYRCQAENKLGKVISNDVVLSFGSLGEFSNVPDAPINAKSYEGAAIECSRINYNPAVTYQWFKNSPAQFIRPQFQTYMFMSQNGKLYFSEVTRADEGNYHCIAILKGTGRAAMATSQPPMRTSLPISLAVSDQTPLADWGPRIQNEFIAVFPKPPLKGDNVRMECFAYGSSTSQFRYNWFRNGRQLPKNAQLLDHNRVLMLRDASLDDQGVYTCTVKRGYSNTDEKSVNLVLGARPYFLSPIGDQHLDRGAQFTWRCEVRANPPARFQWFKNGVALTSDPAKFMIVRGNVLIFHKLDSTTHEGMYQCAATNNHGTTLSEGQLRVLAFAPNFYKNPLQLITQASLDGNITLQCKPEAAPLPTITWSRNGKEIAEWSTQTFQRLNGDLVILGTSLMDQGKYTCKAENEFGVAEGSTKLMVAEGTFITVPPKSESAIVNSTTFFYCQASHAKNSDMIYTWYFNGHLIDPKVHPEYVIARNMASGKSGLYVRSVQFHNMGHYQCKATTPLTEDSKDAYLTVLGPPSPPAGVFPEPLSITQDSVSIRWTVTRDNGRPIVAYMVEAESIYEMGEWEIVVEDLHVSETIRALEEKPIAHIKNLNPGCGYRFRLSAINEMGYGPASDPTTFIHTLSAAPIEFPLHIGGGGGSVGALTITWMPLTKTQEGGPGIGYIVEWRKKVGESYLDKKWTKEVFKGKASKLVKLVGVRNYFLEYEVKITAYNDQGQGPTSDVVIVMSAEDLPSKAPNNIYADGFNGTAMEVFWSPISNKREDAKGIIVGYQVNYWHEEEEQFDYGQFIRYHGQNIDTGIVIGLKSDNFYYFTVQAYNSAGMGPASDFFLQETLHAPPQHYPEEVRLSSAGGHRVNVWWRGIQVQQPESAIDGFTVFYWPANENYRNARMHDVPGHDSHSTRIRVDEGVVYALRVSGYSAGGLGRKSLTTYFTFEGDNILVDQNLIATVEAFESRSSTLSPPGVVSIALTNVFIYMILSLQSCML